MDLDASTTASTDEFGRRHPGAIIEMETDVVASFQPQSFTASIGTDGILLYVSEASYQPVSVRSSCHTPTPDYFLTHLLLLSI